MWPETANHPPPKLEQYALPMPRSGDGGGEEAFAYQAIAANSIMNFPSFARASIPSTLRGRSQLNSLGSFLLREPQVLLTVVLVVLTGVLNPRFLTTRNLINVLRQSSINGIVTVGVCWMMISGSFDLSVGAIVSLISVTMVAMLEGGSGIATTIIFGLGIGLATGIFNGFLVGRLKANPMLTTLGTMTIFQGIALLSAGGYYYRVPRNSPFLLIADGFIGPFAVPTIIFLVLALIMHLILSETSLGARVYAIGGNEEAAKLAGVRVPLYRTLMYVATGVCSAVAAMVVSARAGSGNYFIGLNYEFHAITASVLGGNYIFGGRGSVARGVWGAILVALLNNSLTILGFEPATQLVVQGVVTAGLVAIQVMGRERKTETEPV